MLRSSFVFIIESVSEESCWISHDELMHEIGHEYLYLWRLHNSIRLSIFKRKRTIVRITNVHASTPVASVHVRWLCASQVSTLVFSQTSSTTSVIKSYYSLCGRLTPAIWTPKPVWWLVMDPSRCWVISFRPTCSCRQRSYCRVNDLLHNVED